MIPANNDVNAAEIEVSFHSFRVRGAELTVTWMETGHWKECYVTARGVALVERFDGPVQFTLPVVANPPRELKVFVQRPGHAIGASQTVIRSAEELAIPWDSLISRKDRKSTRLNSSHRT